MKRVFLAWKKFKARKLKLLKKILTRKQKADVFLCSIALAKWRMNSDSIKLQRMTSQTLLKICTPGIPASKKGI